MHQPLNRYLNRFLRLLAISLCGVTVLFSTAMLSSLHADDKDEKPVLDAKAMSTHKQTTAIKPMFDGKPISLNTFCLDQSGNILACVGGDQTSYKPKEDGTYEIVKTESPKALQAYSPDGELLWQVELSFTPTAINQAPNGQIFVAGTGKVARLDQTGKILTIIDSPSLGDLENLRARVAEAAAKQKTEALSSFTEQLDRVKQRIAKIESKPEEERSDREKKQLTAFENQRTLYQEQLAQMEAMYAGMFDTDSAIEQKMTITAIAVNSQDIFVCCSVMEGYGYEVWRLDHQLESPKKVVEMLGGCCGQCDIQANEEHLVVADNTKFQVSLLDRDGQPVSSFGKRDGEAVDGFGSCCNPMNVRCCSNGDILTAESSIGWIKRFNPAGELVSVIGKAGIGGGCKHVALGFDATRDRYYMMNVDKSHICVLVPKAEAPEFNEEELAAQAARAGLGEKLVGSWELAVADKKADEKAGEEAGGAAQKGAVPAVRIISATSTTTTKENDDEKDEKGVEVQEEAADAVAVEMALEMTMPKSLVFHADGKLDLTGSSLFQGSNLKWEAVKQNENKLTVNQIMEGVANFQFEIEFKNDNEAVMSLGYDGNAMMPAQTYRRVKAETKKDASDE